MKKIIRRSILLLLLIALAWAIHYGWVSFPLISGFGAKTICSCMFVSGRSQADIEKEELSGFPYSLGSFGVNLQDSSVTGKVWGMATKKAIYRIGAGCTVVNDIPEAEIRAQVFAIPSPTVVHTDTIAWPAGDKIVDTIPAAIEKARLKAAVDKAFTEPNPDRKTRTRAVVVVYDGQLVAEQYAPGYTVNTMMYGWSMAKSITGALTGILVKEGKLQASQQAPVPEWSKPGDQRQSITLQHILQQTTGLDFAEDYTGASDVTNMLYKTGDMAAYTANYALAHQPGTVFSYTSGNSNILSRIIRHTVGEKGYAAFAYTSLFYKIGMHHSLLEPDAFGTFVGSSYIMATARDFARFGLLYYNDGVWNGERILPQNWVQQTVTAPGCNKQQNYGYQFWLNGIADSVTNKRIYPDVPADMFYCDGYGYQDIYNIPSKRLVVVRTGLTLDRSFDENAFLKDIIAAIR